MGYFNFFGDNEHRVFNYKPIYYDPQEEERKRKFGAMSKFYRSNRKIDIIGRLRPLGQRRKYQPLGILIAAEKAVFGVLAEFIIKSLRRNIAFYRRHLNITKKSAEFRAIFSGGGAQSVGNMRKKQGVFVSHYR